jgi:hypothetical protein
MLWPALAGFLSGATVMVGVCCPAPATGLVQTMPDAFLVAE